MGYLIGPVVGIAQREFVSVRFLVDPMGISTPLQQHVSSAIWLFVGYIWSSKEHESGGIRAVFFLSISVLSMGFFCASSFSGLRTGSLGFLDQFPTPTLQSLWNEALKLLDNPCFGRTCIIQEICSRKTYPCAGSDCGE